ncbi:lanC-like protein 3 homolog [Anopheles maculipalpis]|uniref:lanC-like protein 3 homolog n=1 Tax=Anopheles maculipalpis TaxID=1496333 RepID=UPI0021597BFC|nr:lanC-like protein 3 homolog [Anopheles maculipalpis]
MPMAQLLARNVSTNYTAHKITNTSERFFPNPYADYDEKTHGTEQHKLVSRSGVVNLIEKYVGMIQKNHTQAKMREDLYVGTAGIAFMFWKLSRTKETKSKFPCLNLASNYIDEAKRQSTKKHRSSKDSVAFLCGGAGIAAVSAVVFHAQENRHQMKIDVEIFLKGYPECATDDGYEADEVLVGRAGFLHGAYWLNQTIETKPIGNEMITKVCKVLMKRGRRLATSLRIGSPLMYEYHEKTYLGAAHGICAILHALLESPWFNHNDSGEFCASTTKLADIKNSIDYVLTLQSNDGKFPTRHDSDRTLVHWCHGCGGAIYLFAKAYLTFKEEKYLECCRKSSDTIWRQGLLRKGPGLCHGVAGNGYSFLLMYRLTGELRYLYRAAKFADFLNSTIFSEKLLAPDRPYSLYEGLAGTVCFLADLLNPLQSSFPFMDVFEKKIT